ncbi:unnamed protein product [Peronospora destructor]|uniref:NADPH--hemoprotein reductase n=1 Tax=Peronospora destructor TaxID=86335 RepID=A0AAV0VHX1_9STRA|nr:unnamed protein product [Peronospora destructor]
MQFTVTIAVLMGISVAVMAGTYDGWAPHRYCNSLDNIETTRIPPLTSKQAELVESLEQVQIIARHGARAPYARVFCWESPKHNPMNAEWDCSTISVSSLEINFKEQSKGFGRLYRKSYIDGHNILNGDCIVGGLLESGRQQHKINGEFLRDAYVGRGSLKLFPTAKLSDLELSEIYLRSDDQERTLGSGEALINGLFPINGTPSFELHRMLSWNVADYSMDYISPNEKICPFMKHIEQISSESPEFWSHLRDPATVEIERHFNDVVGSFSWNSVLECLSTARCSNLELPDGVDEETFTKTYHEVEVRQGIFLTYNDSWYSKVAMQPLAHDMLTQLNGALNGDPAAYKLSVTMAHDSTIMPLLAATVKENWDRTWTPYAGMLVLEMYKTKSGSHAVRMIFHGEPQLLPDCRDTLCDVDEFFQAFAFARNPRTENDCKLSETKEKSKSLSSSLNSMVNGQDYFTASNHIGSYLLLGLVAVAGLLALRRRNRQHEMRGSDENIVLLHGMFTRVLRRGCSCAYHRATLRGNLVCPRTAALYNIQQQRRFLVDGMDAFMDFEREMALKRRKAHPEKFASVGPLTPPVEPDDDECCHLDCPNCVLLVYQEQLLEYELSLQNQNKKEKPKIPVPIYDLSFHSSKDDEEVSSAWKMLLTERNRGAFGVAANDVISAPHQTADGAWRSVRHIDFRVRDDQQEHVSKQASNIGVYVPNDLPVVERMLVHLHVDDPSVVYAAEPLANSTQQSLLQHQPLQQRPFAHVGTIRDALTWSFDLISTPRPRFLRNLAAYASDSSDVAGLMAPRTADAIQAERGPHQHVTIADIFDLFPSVRLSFADFSQIVPLNSPRYYTISSSRQFSPDIVSITLGLRKKDALPLPRCSSYLAMLKPGEAIRASFYQSSFVFPYHDHRPIMLISAGTGIAPFRAFLQDLEHEDKTSSHQHRPAYLFYGCREASVDFLYGEELERARESGVLDQLHVTFSDDGDRPKRYVQDALIEQSELVARHLLQDEGYIYLCEFSGSAIATQEDAERVVRQKLAGHLIVTELW